MLLRTKYNGAALQRYRYTPFGEQQVVYAASDLGAFVVPMVTWGELARADGAAGNTNGKLLDRHNYTGHESISHLNLIHMGGRVYDPQIGRMLQADIVVQFPHLVQSYNRYAYVLNNPLSYSDPSGYMLFNDDGSIAESPSGNTASENNAKSDRDSNTKNTNASLGVQNQYYSPPYGTTSVVPNGYMYIRAQEELAEQGTVVVVVDNAQKSFGIGDQIGEIATAGMIVAGFFLGVGPSELVFGPDSIQSRNLSLTPEFQRVRDLFFKTYGSQLSESNDWSGIHATNFGKKISFAEGLKIAWQSPTGAYVGSFTVTDIVGGPNRTLMYALDNRTSLSSLTGSIFGEISYDRTGYTMSPMSTVSQTYFITEQY